MPKRKAADNPPTFSKRQWGRRTVPPPAAAPSPRVVIDHLSFPHIMDAIVAAADFATLAKLALTCRKYHDEWYVGTHFVVTKTDDDELAFAPFDKPGATRVPDVSSDRYMTRRKVGSDAEWLEGLGVVDLKLKTITKDDVCKLKALVYPTIVRAPVIALVNTKVFVNVVHNVAPYDDKKQQFVRSNKPIADLQRDRCLPTGVFEVYEHPEKLVLAVHFSSVRPPAFSNTLRIVTASPIVIHLVNVDDGPSLDNGAASTPTKRKQRGFGADNVHGMLHALVSPQDPWDWVRMISVTVVGLETVNPWAFTSKENKARIAPLAPDAREQHLRHLLSFRPSRAKRLEFVTVDEYAQGMPRAMLALERGEGFAFP